MAMLQTLLLLKLLDERFPVPSSYRVSPAAVAPPSSAALTLREGKLSFSVFVVDKNRFLECDLEEADLCVSPETIVQQVVNFVASGAPWPMRSGVAGAEAQTAQTGAGDADQAAKASAFTQIERLVMNGSDVTLWKSGNFVRASVGLDDDRGTRSIRSRVLDAEDRFFAAVSDVLREIEGMKEPAKAAPQ